MILLIVSFATGVVVIQQFTSLPSLLWLCCAGIAALCCACFRLWRLMFFTMGLLWAGWFANDRLYNRLPLELEGQELVIEGQISGLPQSNGKGVRFNFTPDHAQDPLASRLPDKLRISWYYPETAIKAGQRWRLTVRLKRPHGSLNPGGFDYERWLFLHEIGATGYVRSTPAPILMHHDPAWFNIGALRQKIADQLEVIFTDHNRLGIVQALIIGDRHNISSRQWDVFRKTGTVHLVAISGLHIGLIAGLVYFAVLKCWAYSGILRLSPPCVAALSACFAGLFYALLAGFSIPTVRAFIMLSIAMAAIIWQRHTKPYTILAAALFAILIFDPLSVLSPGFWLSFLAVVVIVYALAGRTAKSGYWLSMLKINWVTCIGIAPLLVFFFHQVSLIAPIANLIAVPLISFFIVPLALVSTLVMQFIPAFGELLFRGVDLCLLSLYSILSYLAGLPFSSMKQMQANSWPMLLSLSGAFVLLAPRGIPVRWLGVVLMLPLAFSAPKNIDQGKFELTLLDVGQGLSTVVQTQNHVLVFDSGAKFLSGFDMGNSVVLPFLYSQGLDKIDTLLISHGDNDHIGGAESILQGIAVGKVLTGIAEEFPSINTEACLQGQQWIWDHVTFSMLAPPRDKFTTENDNSCVLKIDSEYGGALLTGDIEKAAEQWLVKNYPIKLQAEILIAPHHGSNTSSSKQFLKQVNPDYVLIPSGYRNRFGHPNNQVLSRYSEQQINWLTVAYAGALNVTYNKDNIQVQSFRQTDRRYWHWSAENLK